MLSNAEKTLLNANLSGFPMISAASAAWKRCGKCGHANVNVNAALRLAATKYADDPAFVEACRRLFPLPCMIGGVLIK